MAIDTALKRFSAINHGNPWRGIFPIPDGSVDDEDRLITAFLYGGLAIDAGDTTPDQFTFTDQSGVALSSTITSAPITVTGIDAAAAITVSGGTYDINESGTFVGTEGTVSNGDTVRARHTSSASYLTTVNTTVTIGGVSDTFSSQTQPDPSSSDPRGSGRLGIRLGVGE